MSIEGILIALLWLVIWAVVIYVVYWGVGKVLAAFDAPPKIMVLIQVAVVVALVLVAVIFLRGVLPAPRWR